MRKRNFSNNLESIVAFKVRGDGLIKNRQTGQMYRNNV